MNLSSYLESTFLQKEEDFFSENKILTIINSLIKEAIDCKFKLVMLRPEYINYAKKIISSYQSDLSLGTVIDFPLGDKSKEEKIKQALIAINNGVSELDFVCDYNAFKRSQFKKFDSEIIEVSKVVLKHEKVIKWIIETGALSKKQIFNISLRISNIIDNNFKLQKSNFYLKTSTGFYKGTGATFSDIKIIKEASNNIKIKASGGIKTYDKAIKMINAGVARIGTSSAFKIYKT